MNFLCPSCRTPLPRDPAPGLVTCTQCSVQVDLTRVDTAPGQARLWPEVDLKGETLSGHTLLSRLGSGGMGTVYEAESPVGAAVAMKVLSPMLAAEPALRERFRREARALTAVKHPRVVQLYEEGEDKGFCWYSMELIKGLDLRHRLEKGVLQPAEVENLATALLEALGAIHEAGVVHRDVKPANILLGPDGPRLCDFGIAQVAGATTLTESAALLGSLRYMAPEQRWGQADDRSDLYALGVVLHECLALGVPGEQPLPAGTPAHLAQFIARLTQQSPKARPGSAAEAVALLKALKKGTRRRAIVAAGVGGVVALIAVIALVASGGDEPEATPPKPSAPLAEVAQVDAGPAPVDAGTTLVQAGTIDIDVPEVLGELVVRVRGATGVEVDGQRGPVPKEALKLALGTHRIRVECPDGGKRVAARFSPLLEVDVSSVRQAEATWDCFTMSKDLVALAPPPKMVRATKGPTKPVAKPLPVNLGGKKKKPGTK